MPYPTEVQSWKTVVPDKWLIFDSDAIISILAFGQIHIFDELKELGVSFVYIHPCLLELMNTNQSEEKLRRTKLLVDYDFLELPLTQNEVKLASRIQRSLPLKCQPSPTDLYLGGFLARHNGGDRLLLTANIKDFPLPIYTRKGHILLQSDTNLKTLSILCTDNSMLID